MNLRERALRYRQYEAKRSVRPRSILKKRNIFWRYLNMIPQFFIDSKYHIYTKPVVPQTDCAFMLINLHVNFRSFCRFTDHALSQGPIFTIIIYTLSHAVMCPTLCQLYAFLGRYSERSFINIWDMVPILQGISVTMVFYECLKMIETSLILSYAGIMLINGYYTDFSMFNETTPLDPNCRKVYSFTDGAAIHYGLSRRFNEVGNRNADGHGYDGLMSIKVYVMAAIWFSAMFIRMSPRRKFHLFLERGMPMLTILLIGSLTVSRAINAGDYNIKLEEHLSKVNFYEYLYITAFSITDYLPSHWITIGHLYDQPLTSTQVTSTSMLSAVACCGIAYSCAFYICEFAYALGVPPACTPSYGLHFFLVVVPYSILIRCKSIAIILIPVYICIIVLKTMSYITTSHRLMMWALLEWRPWLYRFRFIITIASMAALGAIALALSTHDGLRLQIQIVAFHNTEMITLVLTLMGVAIYGLRRLNGDHQYLMDSEYPNIRALKLLLVIGLNLFIMYVLSIVNTYHELMKTKGICSLVSLVLLAPLPLGVLKTIILQKKYKWRIFHPLATWGRADPERRDERRTLSLRQMFIRRLRRECTHNCLSRSAFFEAELNEEMRLRRRLLDSINMDLLKSNIRSSSSHSSASTLEYDPSEGEINTGFQKLTKID